MKNQTALKGLLLVALTASLSGKPILRSFNFSSTSSEMVSTSPAPNQQPSAPLAVPKLPTTAITVSDVGVKPDAAARAATVSDRTDEIAPAHVPRLETPKICGQRWSIQYTEIVTGGQKITQVFVKPHSGEMSSVKVLFRFDGGFETNVDNAEIKKENDTNIASSIARKLGHCSASDEEPQGQKNEVLTREDKESIKRGMKECRLTSKGSPMSEVQQTRCRLRQLEELDADPDDSRSKSKAIGQLEKIIRGDLRKSIKNRLMSNDSAKNDEGEELLSQAIDDIKDSGASLGLDAQRTARIVGELEALRVGGETYRRSASLQEQVKSQKADMADQLRTAQADAKASPNDIYAQQRFLQVQKEILQKQQQLQSQVQTDIQRGPYSKLVAAQSMGYVSSTEFSQFIQPYQDLNKDVLGILDQRSMLNGDGSTFTPSLGALGSSNTQVPADFQSYRANLATSFQKEYGVSVPQRPTTVGSPLANPITPQNQIPYASSFNNYSNLTAAPVTYSQPSVVGGQRW